MRHTDWAVRYKYDINDKESCNFFFLALASFISVDAQNEVVGGYVKKGGTESGLCRELHCISLINRGQSHIKCCNFAFFRKYFIYLPRRMKI